MVTVYLLSIFLTGVNLFESVKSNFSGFRQLFNMFLLVFNLIQTISRMACSFSNCEKEKSSVHVCAYASACICVSAIV